MNFTQITLKIASEVEQDNSIDLAEVVSRLKVEYIPDKRIDWQGETLKSKATTVLCNDEFYSIGGGIFQRFNDMCLKDQMRKLRQWEREIKNIQKKHEKYEKQIKGQIIMEFKEDGTIEYKEVV